MSKISFWLKRIAQLLIVLLLVTFGVSLLLRLIPVDLATILLPAASEGEREILRAELGFDKGPIGYYLQWLGNFVQGDFGKIYFSGGTEEVSDHLKQAMPRSLLLMVYTQILSLVIAAEVKVEISMLRPSAAVSVTPPVLALAAALTPVALKLNCRATGSNIGARPSAVSSTRPSNSATCVRSANCRTLSRAP